MRYPMWAGVCLAGGLAGVGCGNSVVGSGRSSDASTIVDGAVDRGDSAPVDASPRAPDGHASFDAQVTSSADFQELGGTVVMETENFTTNTGGWISEGNGEASAGQFMRAQANRDIAKRVEFTLFFRRTGWYKVWIRSRSSNDGDNDCYVLLDGQPGSARTGSGWVEVAGIKSDRRSWGGWDCIVKSDAALPLDVLLAGTHIYVAQAGDHVFALGSRSVNFQVDKIMLVHEDEATEPSGLGPPETTR